MSDRHRTGATLGALGIDILVSNIARVGDRRRNPARFRVYMERAVSFASQRASRINSANFRLSAIASAV